MQTLMNTSIKLMPPNYSFTTAEYDHFQVVVVLGGKLHFTSGAGVETKLTAGGAAVLRKNSAFTLSTGEEEGYHGVCGNVYHVEKVGDPAFRGAAAAFPADPALAALADLLDREARAPGKRGGVLMEHLGWALAYAALRCCDSAALPGHDDHYARYWADRVRAALDAAVYGPAPTHEVLSALGLSYRQLARYFTAVSGRSPKRYQVEARVREAKCLLTATRLTITAIAYELGYPSSQHFSGQFRSVTGMSPRAYRQGQA